MIQGNYVGTDVTGALDLGNQFGILLAGAMGSTIGGTSAAAGNLISGNVIGINLLGSSNNNIIHGNLIGTNATGTAAIGNDAAGIAISTSSSNVIGGASVAERNVISGNNGNGIDFGATTEFNRVEGNLIGLAVDGVSPLGNQGHGVFSGSSLTNTIGGTAQSALNIIAFNGGDGIATASFAGTNNLIQGNTIFANSGLGIDIANDGVTPNVPTAHTNYPVITSANVAGGSTTVSGTINSARSAIVVVQVFANSAADPTGFGEGEIFLGTTAVTTDTNGNGTFTLTVPTAFPSFYMSARTIANGEGSEFSQVLQAPADPTVFTWDGSSGSDWFTPANWTPDGVPGPGDTAILDINSTINLPRDTSVAVFRQSDGTFMSPAGSTFTVMESFEWSGGRQTGAGTTLLAIGSNSLFSGAASKNLEGRFLNNAGDVIWTGAGAIGMPGGTITILQAAFLMCRPTRTS